MDERNVQEAIGVAQLGADMKDFVRHPGYAVLQKFISSKVADQRNEWLKASTPQQAEEIRLKAKPYAEIEDYLKRLIVEGLGAEHNLRQYRSEIEDLSK